MAGLEGVVNEKLVEGYISLAKEQIRTDEGIQKKDIADRISDIEKVFKKVDYAPGEEDKPKNKYAAKIVNAAKKLNNWPITSIVADVSKVAWGMAYEFYGKGKHAYKKWRYEKKLDNIKWAEDEIESLNHIGKEMKMLAQEYKVKLSYGNGAFGAEIKGDEEGDAKKERLNEFFERAENIGFIKQDVLLYLPGYQKMVKFMVGNSDDKKFSFLSYLPGYGSIAKYLPKNPEGKRLSFLKRDDDSIKDKDYGSMFRIENLDRLKERTERKKTLFEIKSELAEEYKWLKKKDRILGEGYKEITRMMETADFRDYLNKNKGWVQKELGDIKKPLTRYIYGKSRLKHAGKKYFLGPFSRWFFGSWLKNDKGDLDAAIKILWGNDQYAILTREQLDKRRKLPGRSTMANILNTHPELRESLEKECDKNGYGLMALKIDNAFTKEMSEHAMVIAKNYHNVIRVPIYGIAHLFDTRKDKKELVERINKEIKVVDIYHELGPLAKEFREWYSGLGFEKELSDDKGLLRIFNELKDDFKDKKTGLTLAEFEKRVNGDLEGHMDGLTLIYRSKARKFVNNYIEKRKETEKEFTGSLEFMIKSFNNMFSMSAYDQKHGKIICDSDLEASIGESILDAKNMIVKNYGKQTLIHSIQTRRAESITGMAQTLLATGLVYKFFETVTKTQSWAMFAGANFDDVFASIVDTIESLTGTATERRKRIAYTVGGTVAGVALGGALGLYLFSAGPLYLGAWVIPQVIKHGIGLALIAAAGSQGALLGNSIYYSKSYKMLEEEGRILPREYLIDNKGNSIADKLKAPLGRLREGFREEMTRPFVRGMFTRGVPAQIVAGISIGCAAYYLNMPKLLYNPYTVSGVGYAESFAGLIFMYLAGRELSKWTKGLVNKRKKATLENRVGQSNNFRNPTPGA